MNRRARILVPCEPSAVAFARDRVLIQVRAWGVPLDEELRDAVRLVASELIANAVVHSGGLATVGLYLNDGRLLLVVHDGNQAEPQRQCATGEDEDGRGLALVEFLATRNGWEPTARGKKVWAGYREGSARLAVGTAPTVGRGGSGLPLVGRAGQARPRSVRTHRHAGRGDGVARQPPELMGAAGLTPLNAKNVPRSRRPGDVLLSTLGRLPDIPEQQRRTKWAIS